MIKGYKGMSKKTISGSVFFLYFSVCSVVLPFTAKPRKTRNARKKNAEKEAGHAVE